MRDSSSLKWGFGLQWVLASAVGVALFAPVFRRLSMAVGGAAGEAVGGAVGRVVAEAVVGALALGGVMLAIGIPQWLVVRRQVSWAGWLVLASAVGGAVGGAMTLGVFEGLAVFAGETLRAVVGVVAGLTVFGVTQWLALRRQVPWAGWWVLASVVGLAAAGPSLAILTFAGLGDMIGRAGFGAVYGAITGGALVWLLRQPVPAASTGE